MSFCTPVWLALQPALYLSANCGKTIYAGTSSNLPSETHMQKPFCVSLLISSPLPLPPCRYTISGVCGRVSAQTANNRCFPLQIRQGCVKQSLRQPFHRHAPEVQRKPSKARYKRKLCKNYVFGKSYPFSLSFFSLSGVLSENLDGRARSDFPFFFRNRHVERVKRNIFHAFSGKT